MTMTLKEDILDKLKNIYEEARQKSLGLFEERYGGKSPLYNSYLDWIREWSKKERSPDYYNIRIPPIIIDTLATIELIEHLVGSDYKGELVDVGCGCGLFTLELAQRLPYAQITGIDKEDYSVFFEKLKKHKSYWRSDLKNAEYVVTSIEKYLEYVENEKERKERVLCLFNMPYGVTSYLLNKLPNTTTYQAIIGNFDIFTFPKVPFLTNPRDDIGVKSLEIPDVLTEVLVIAYKRS